MAFIAYPNNYDFHEETLSDRMVEVKNTFTRKVLHNELVLLDGYFGEVCEFDGIANNKKGFININSERIIRTTQVKSGISPDFTPGSPVYFVPQTNSAAGELSSNNESNTAIAVGTVRRTDEDNSYVEFRPYVQDVGVSLMRDPDSLLEDMVEEAAEAVVEVLEVATRTAQIVIGTLDDATGAGIDVALDDIGMEKDDIIIDVAVLATGTVSAGTLNLKHGDSGDAISGAVACAVTNVLTRAATLTKPVATDEGFTVVANGAADEGIIFITYIKG